jgi:hypothetical protein
VQHALLRGIEAVFQLEEGEILAEPMPTRDERNGFLLYEATEGGAGVLTRLVAEPTTVAEVAQTALRIMHFELGEPATIPTDPGDLTDAAATLCVAACYRCLMSYYNQPDHELIDRRDNEARSLLLRLARSKTSGLDRRGATSSSPKTVERPAAMDSDLRRWLDQARLHGLPNPDTEPITLNGARIPLVWREHYVAVLLAADPPVSGGLEGKGFDVLVFTKSEADWPSTFVRLATALGRTL